MAYTKLHDPWHNAAAATGGGDTSTPLDAAALNYLEAGIAAAVASPASIAVGEIPVWDGAAFVRGRSQDKNAAVTVSASNTDLAWSWGYAASVYLNVTTTGGTLRSLGTPTGSGGTTVHIRNGGGTNVTLLHDTAGGAGLKLYNTGGVSIVLAPGASVSYSTEGSIWLQVSQSLSSWIPYTPSWFSDGTQPAINNGTLTGRYAQDGKLFTVDIVLTAGTTTTFGTGTLNTWSTPSTLLGAVNYGPLGRATLFDSSAGQIYVGDAIRGGATSVGVWAGVGLGWWFATYPVTLATGDIIQIRAIYEAA
jgi:hypothetical protein